MTAPQGQYFVSIKASSPYGIVTSTPIEVVVADLCLETDYSITVPVIDMTVTVLGPSVQAPFDRPVS